MYVELLYSALFVLILIIMLKWLFGKVKDSGNDLNVKESKSPIKIEQEVENEPAAENDDSRSVKPGSKSKAKRQLQRDTDESSTETESESEKIRKDGKSRKVSLRSKFIVTLSL